jgi:hypothetical protein
MIVRVEITHSGRSLDEMKRQLGDPKRIRAELADVLDESARIGAQAARTYAPKRTTRLADQIKSQPARITASDALEAKVTLGKVDSRLRRGESGAYPLAVETGTGVHGPEGRPIRSPRGGLMTFFGRGGWVSKRTIQGQRPQPYMHEAFRDVDAYLPQRIDEAVHRLFE